MEIMIDIETLGTAPGSVITQIGVARFDSAKIQSAWSSYVDIDAQIALGSTMDIDTLRWWCGQGADALAAQITKRIGTTPEEVLEQLSNQVRGCVGVWANSPSFDLVMLESLYGRAGMPVPWRFTQTRDQRTILVANGHARASQVLKSDPSKAHDAGYDARYQAEVVRRLLWK